jgi:hypothetical protein
MEEKDIIEQALFDTKYNEFMKSIEAIHNGGQSSYMDSIVHYCSTNSLEIESVASLVNKNPKLKETIREEAEELNYIPKTTKLPL